MASASKKRLWAGCLLALPTAALSIASACLPDLSRLAPLPDAESDAPAQTTLCGDGVIETFDDGGDAGESCDPGTSTIPGCTSCAFSCPDGVLDDAGHCYFALPSGALTYQAAISGCLNASAHVVTFASDRESSVVRSMVDGGEYWVGLKRTATGYFPPSLTNEPGLPPPGESCGGCYAPDGSFDFALHPGTTDAAVNDCVVASAALGIWSKTTCEASFRTICEREPPGERSQPCIGALCTTITATIGSKRYVVPFTEATAEQADAYCRTIYGGSLVVFESREEREQLVREFLINQTTSYFETLRSTPTEPIELWIGLSIPEAGTGAWMWADGVIADGASRPLPWGRDQPTALDGGHAQAYLRMDNETSFDTQLATNERGAGDTGVRAFICQRPVN